MKLVDRIPTALRRLRIEKSHLLLAMAVGMTLVVYGSIKNAYFIADDFVDLIHIADQGSLQYLVSPFAGHMIFTRQFIVLVMTTIFGVRHPEAFAFLNLAVHVANTVLVFRVTRTLTSSLELAALGAALWGTCPVLWESVSWFAVCGHLISATFILLVLDDMLRHQVSHAAISSRAAIRWCVLLFLGATCFGGATAVAVVFPLLVFLCFERSLRPPRAMLAFASVSVVVVVLYGSWNWLYSRFYEMPEDLKFIQSAALSSVRTIVEMFGDLPAIGVSHLLSGFDSVSSPHTAIRWSFVVAFAIALGAAFFFGSVILRRQMLVLLGVALIVYGTIALGRANLYRAVGIGPLDAAHQFRYHYVSTIFFSILLMLTIGRLAQVRGRQELPLVLLVAWAVSNGYAFAKSGWSINDRRDCRIYVANAMRQIDSMIDAAPPGGDVEISSPRLPPFCTGIMGYDAIPGWAGLFVIFYPDDRVRGRNVHFVQPEDYVSELDDPRHRRFWKLLLPP